MTTRDLASGWHYRLAYVDYPHLVDFGEPPERQWGVVEHYPSLGASTSFVMPIGDDKESLFEVLHLMIKDLKYRGEDPVELEPDERVDEKTPYDDEITANGLAVAVYEVGTVPESMLKRGLLLAVKRDCYRQGVSDALGHHSTGSPAHIWKKFAEEAYKQGRGEYDKLLDLLILAEKYVARSHDTLDADPTEVLASKNIRKALLEIRGY